MLVVQKIAEIFLMVNTLFAARSDLEVQVKDRQSLEKQERKFWKEYSKHKRELLLAEDEFRTIDLQNKYVSDQLDKLRKTNVFNQVWSTTIFSSSDDFMALSKGQ